tara:strand:- start:2189 stop:3070 length:882 start_codon:yes stop_codon:yes gene_type:complete
MSRYGKYFGSSAYTGYLKGLSKKDKKRAEFFTDILKDNKIKKSEAKELLEKGYTERDLQRFDTKVFRDAQDYYKSFHSRDKGYSSATLDYSPFTISRGAGNLFSSGLSPAKPEEPDLGSTDPNYGVEPQPETPTNDYQSQIDTLLEQISTNQTAAENAAKERQAAFDKTIADMTAGFNTRAAELQAGFQSQMLAADQARQAEIREIMSANQAQMDRMAAEQAARQQQMQIAQQTQAANAARAGQTGQFKVGTGAGGGGIGQFKRRLQIKPMTSAALAIAGGKKSAGNNKMLNV